jgi:hypothetical protein
MCKACRDAIRHRVSLVVSRPEARETLRRVGAAIGRLAALTKLSVGALPASVRGRRLRARAEACKG